MDYRVLLYYNYTTIEDPAAFAKEHLAFCKSIGLKGRILVAEEGINGTVSGTIEATEAYMEHMHADERFKDTWFKIDEAEGHAFRKMFVRPRRELVALNLEDDINPHELTGEYLDPKAFKEALLDEDTIVLDARNDYEFDLGHFRGAVRPDIRNFRELPQWIRDNKEKFMDKKVVTYCTGGIRCEKFSGWLLREGVENVAQLHGGIAMYGKDPEQDIQRINHELSKHKGIQQVSNQTRFLTGETKAQQVALLENCFAEELFIQLPEASDKATVLSELLTRVEAVEKQPVGERLLQQLKLRDTYSSVAFSPYLAVPHPIEPVTEQAHVAVAIAPKGIFWDEAHPEVQLVFLSLPDKARQVRIDKINQMFVPVIEDDAFRRSLAECQTFDEFMKKFIEHL